MPLRALKGQGAWGEWHSDGNGYLRRTRTVSPRVRESIYQHVHVMQEHLGRDLLPGENVHHINGVKHDNRLENLELWVSSQPKGQRPSDLVAWAKEILERYDAEALGF